MLVNRDGRKQTKITHSHLEHKVDRASVRGDGHSTPFWNRLGGRERDDGLRIRQGLNLQTVLLHQGHSRRIYALEVTWGKLKLSITEDEINSLYVLFMYVHMYWLKENSGISQSGYYSNYIHWWGKGLCPYVKIAPPQCKNTN